MKMYFCPVYHSETLNGTSIGRTFAYNNKSRWVEAPQSLEVYLTAGYMKGVDHVIINNKAFMIMKTYIDIAANSIIIVCIESITGCDN